MPHKRKPTKSPVFLERVAQEKQALQQVTREKYAHIRIDLSSDFQPDLPDSDLLSRHVTAKRGTRSRMSAPPHFVHTTRTESRGKEQSKKHIPVRDFRHTIQIRTLLLDSRRQKKVENGAERLEKFIWYPPEKTYQVKDAPKRRKQAVVYRMSGAVREQIERGDCVTEVTLRERL